MPRVPPAAVSDSGFPDSEHPRAEAKKKQREIRIEGRPILLRRSPSTWGSVKKNCLSRWSARGIREIAGNSGNCDSTYKVALQAGAGNCGRKQPRNRVEPETGMETRPASRPPAATSRRQGKGRGVLFPGRLRDRYVPRHGRTPPPRGDPGRNPVTSWLPYTSRRGPALRSESMAPLFDALAPERERWLRRNRYYYRQVADLCRSVIPARVEGAGDRLRHRRPPRRCFTRPRARHRYQPEDDRAGRGQAPRPRVPRRRRREPRGRRDLRLRHPLRRRRPPVRRPARLRATAQGFGPAYTRHRHQLQLPVGAPAQARGGPAAEDEGAAAELALVRGHREPALPHRVRDRQHGVPLPGAAAGAAAVRLRQPLPRPAARHPQALPVAVRRRPPRGSGGAPRVAGMLGDHSLPQREGERRAGGPAHPRPRLPHRADLRRGRLPATAPPRRSSASSPPVRTATSSSSARRTAAARETRSAAASPAPAGRC